MSSFNLSVLRGKPTAVRIKTGNRTWNGAVETAGEGKWDAGKNRGGRPLGRRPLFFPSLGPTCLSPRLHAHGCMSRLHVRLHVLLMYVWAGLPCVV